MGDRVVVSSSRRPLESLRPALRRVLDQRTVNRLVTTAVRRGITGRPELVPVAEARLRRTGVCTVHVTGSRTMLMDAGSQSEWLTNRLYWGGPAAYEQAEIGVLLALCRGAKVVLDVGSHVGWFALQVALQEPAARVIAFEPVAEVFDRLARNVVLNKLTNVMCVPAAVGAGRAQLPLFSPLQGIDTNASFSVEHRLAWHRGPWRCDITEVVTVDEFAASTELPTVDLVKIDVEQVEDEVLAGMRTTLERHRPHIMCEVLPHGRNHEAMAHRIDELIRPYGYRIYLLGPDGPVLRPQVTGDRNSWNQLFTVLEPDALARALT